MVLIEIGLFLITFLLALHYYGIKKCDHFKNTDIKYLPPSVFRTIKEILFRRDDIMAIYNKTYTMFPGERYTGHYGGFKPLILVKDLELLKQIGIKEFDTFHDHRSFIPENNSDTLEANNLFAMTGERWKEMRASLSPIFTSAKIKNMFFHIEECAKDTVEFLLNQDKIKEKQILEIEVKDTVSRYTNDVIATTAFGLKVNSLNDRENEFYLMGKKITNFGGLMLTKMMILILLPAIAKFLRLTFIDSGVSNFFRTLVKNTVKDREDTGIVRNDVIQLLIEAKNGTLTYDAKDSTEIGFATVQESSIGKQQIKRKWTDTELASQAFIFFVAGFETSSTMITFLIYEIMKNPEIQKKLQEEIDNFNLGSGGKISYNDIQKLKYLDMTISESLRMWPPVAFVDRVASKQFTLPPPNENSNNTYTFEKGQVIFIPISGLLQDPQYFPDPEKFDPERFSDENKGSIEAMAYLPFGIGPRNCIGSRFALLEIKLLIFHILSKFDIIATENSQIPIKLDKRALNLKSEKGVIIGLRPRSSK